jgi:hypothetical protein
MAFAMGQQAQRTARLPKRSCQLLRVKAEQIKPAEGVSPRGENTFGEFTDGSF